MSYWLLESLGLLQLHPWPIHRRLPAQVVIPHGLFWVHRQLPLYLLNHAFQCRHPCVWVGHHTYLTGILSVRFQASNRLGKHVYLGVISSLGVFPAKEAKKTVWSEHASKLLDRPQHSYDRGALLGAQLCIRHNNQCSNAIANVCDFHVSGFDWVSIPDNSSDFENIQIRKSQI